MHTFLLVLLHWSSVTHLFCLSSSTVPRGHWQPITHCKVHIPGLGLLQVGGHAVPHEVNSWPSISHFGFFVLLHWSLVTHLFCSSSSTVPWGHWQPITHCKVHIPGLGLLQVGGHAVPHEVNSWPSISHFGFFILLHWSLVTHLFCSSSSTVPWGHWQPITHCSVHTPGSGLLQVSGHAVPQSVNSWPLISHAKKLYRLIAKKFND